MSPRNRLATLFITIAVILLLSMLAVYVGGDIVMSVNRRVMRHQNAIEQLDGFFSTLKDAETGQRGYIITGDDRYLAPYNSAVARVGSEMNGLDELVKTGDLPADAVRNLESLSSQKLTELDQTIAIRRAQGFDAARVLVVTNVGKTTMDAFRTQIRALVQDEDARLVKYQTWMNRATIARTSIFLVTGMINLIFLAWAYRHMCQEIDRRLAASQETARQKELLATTLASIGDAVLVTDEQAHISFMNSIAETLTGWNSDEAKGQPLTTVFRIINEDSRQPVESPVDKVLRLGIVVGLANHTLLIRRDGREIPIDDSGAPIRDTDGKVRGVVLVFRDFSEHKETERRMMKARNDAETANKAKDQFLAALSHELRTPLTPVLAMLTNWEADGRLPEIYREDITVLRRNVELEARLIDDLLDINRIAKGKLTLHTEVVEVHRLLDAVLGICRSDTNAKRLDVRLELTAREHYVKADSARLQQVFWNIIRNAAKFTPEQGKIVIRTESTAVGLDSSVLTISVTDTGMGMTPEVIAKLFRPFEQGSADVPRWYGGLGLGMALSKALLDMQSGTISASSLGPAQGSTFYVTLPAVKTPDNAPAPSTQRASLHRTLRILLVEDHPDTARTMGRLLEKLGHQVRIAGSVAAACNEVGQEHVKFDLLLSDIGLPDGSGIELIREIRKRSQLPAIALTGFGMEEDVSKCLEAGFNAHLTKPVNFKKLEVAIQRIAAGEPLGASSGDTANIHGA